MDNELMGVADFGPPIVVLAEGERFVSYGWVFKQGERVVAFLTDEPRLTDKDISRMQRAFEKAEKGA